MDAARCRALLSTARVGRLATVRPSGRPHVVVCCFAVVGDRVWTAVDSKPKASSSGRLQRLENVRAHPWASLLVDHYEEDWDALWWVRVDGPAEVLREGSEFVRALDALGEKYSQYAGQPPAGPVIAIAAERVSGWAARG
jgi:PPOX class probable F420-dependent enzyme